jgi:hypothetical protein
MNVIHLLKKAVAFCYFLLIAAGILLPSDGQHGLLSPKSLGFVSVTFLTILYFFFRQRMTIYQLSLMLGLFLALGFLFLWVFVGMDETPAISQKDQLKLFILTLSIPIITIYLSSEGIISGESLLKAVVYASFAYAALKIALVVLHLLNLVDVWSLLSKFGFRFMRMNIYGSIERVQTSVDVLTPFVAFFFLQSKRFGITWRAPFWYAYVVLTMCSTFLSFSRYLIFIYGLACLLYVLTLDFKGILKFACSIILLVIFCIAIVGPEISGKIIEQRLFSLSNWQSDATRFSQASALLEEHDKAPFFGKGIGGYAEAEIRDPELLHSYEVQWVAFLMQFGLLGLIVLLIPLAIFGFRLLALPLTRVRISFFAMYGLWLLSGFTNPFLISLASGIMYSLFWVAADVLKAKEKSDLKIHYA